MVDLTGSPALPSAALAPAIGAGLLIVTLVLAAVLSTRAGLELTRRVLRALVRALYAFRVEGADLVPRSGGVLLVANHVSYADAFLLGACVERPVRFLMHKSFFATPLIGAFARWFGAIPVASGDTREERERALSTAVEALRAGQVVAIFAEGRITRTGSLLGYRRGLELIAGRAGVPIVPAALDEVWGSIFSFAGGRALWKWPRHLPYRVSVSFGPPLPSESPSHVVRDATSELLARSAERRALLRPDLARSFVRTARRHARRLAVVDGQGQRLTYRELLVGSLLAARELERRLGTTRRVGVLLPPSAGAALVHLAAALSGRTIVPLNYALGPQAVAAAVRRSGVTLVLSSARFLEALGWRDAAWEGEAAQLEVARLLDGHGRPARLRAWLESFLPARWLERRLPVSVGAGDPATILFSSGSSGEPKGVVLTHANLAANVRALAQVAELTPDERVLGVLPFFHAFGSTVTLWAPLLAGACCVLHADPFDVRGVGRLARRERVTALVATPAMLQAWVRRLEPADLASVRLAISGAQRLPADLLEAWRERFGHALHEGYGATELGPVVAVDLPDVERGGMRQRNHAPGTVGRPLPGVAVRVVSLEDGRLCEPEQDGRILVRGPGVMQGYLDDPQATARVLRDGWYDTGDVGRLDRDGFLAITDRLARFSKIGGEQVAHARVEGALLEAWRQVAPAGGAAPELAVVGVEDARRGERLVVVHTPLSVGVPRLIEQARADGLPNLLLPRLGDWVEVAALPLLGSGKLDLRAVRDLARARPGGAPGRPDPAPGAPAAGGGERGAAR